MMTDLSSAGMPGPSTFSVNETTADAQRNWFVRLFTGTSEADKQDFNRSEMSADNQYLRDLALQNHANDFSANEAQKQRDFEERMSSSAYQRAVSDMKAAGINPILALSNQGGASTPQGVAASSSGARSGSSNYRNKVQDTSAALVGAVLGAICGGLVKALLGNAGN